MPQSGTTRKQPAERSAHEIRIWIDDYNDIFSDFDPRDYSERNISDDFLHEVKRVASENDDDVKNLRLLIEEKLRDEKIEATIVTRIHKELARNYRLCDEKRRKLRSRSILFLTAGLLMILGASLFSYLKEEHPLMHIPLVILEPAGWFLTWTGLDQIFRSGKQSVPDFVFFGKLSHSKIVFGNI